MDEQILFDLLRADLNRLGERPDDDYLKTLLRAARLDLERRGVHFPDDANGVDVEDYQTLIVGTASWMYSKRRTGETMPQYLRSLKNSILFAQKAGKER